MGEEIYLLNKWGSVTEAALATWIQALKFGGVGLMLAAPVLVCTYNLDNLNWSFLVIQNSRMNEL